MMLLKSIRNRFSPRLKSRDPKPNHRWISHPLLYNLLKVEPNAPKTQIKFNYYTECMKYHPDHEGGTTNQFLEINKAFQILNCPHKKQLYDGLDTMQYLEFLSIWKVNFHENKKKIEKLNQYIKNNNLQNKFSVYGYFISKLINHYNQVVIYDQQKAEKCAKFNQSRHLYFILDISASMNSWDTTDSNYTSVPKTPTRSGYSDGKYCDYYDVDDKYRHISDQARYINKSIKNIKLICEQLKSSNNGYLTSLMTFSRENQKLWQYQPIDAILNNIDYVNVNSLDKNQFTHIYDALKSAINQVKENGNVSLTNFILLTDGHDFKSQTEIEEILQMIKNINIIILTINVEETTDLKKICDHAKSGKLLKIGGRHDYGFQTIEQAFSKTKDLILYNHNISFIDIKKEFDL